MAGLKHWTFRDRRYSLCIAWCNVDSAMLWAKVDRLDNPAAMPWVHVRSLGIAGLYRMLYLGWGWK
jgi:hypothetical protein